LLRLIDEETVPDGSAMALRESYVDRAAASRAARLCEPRRPIDRALCGLLERQPDVASRRQVSAHGPHEHS
jgi:hypothetical protein